MHETIGTALAQVSRLLRRDFDVRARDVGVTRPQWQLLSLLRLHKGIQQGKLAELLEVEPITLGRMIDRLQTSGLVERIPDPTDRRAWRIHLTDRGGEFADQLRPAAKETFALALAGISDEDAATLMRVLEAIRANLSRKSGGSTPY